jgi:hypothetical protein
MLPPRRSRGILLNVPGFVWLKMHKAFDSAAVSQDSWTIFQRGQDEKNL